LQSDRGKGREKKINDLEEKTEDCRQKREEGKEILSISSSFIFLNVLWLSKT